MRFSNPYFNTDVRGPEILLGTPSPTPHGAATDTLTVGLFKVTLPQLYAPRRGRSCALTASDAAPETTAAQVAQLLG